MSSTVRTSIVAACTDRKRAPIPERLRLRSLDPGTLEARARAWCERLAEPGGIPRHRALDLYAGEHWTLAKASLAALLRAQRPASLWVASAGYGLVSAEAPLCPYSATFSPDAPDSVVDATDAPSRDRQSQLWWKTLGEALSPQMRAPRSLKALVHEAPAGALVVIASPHYIRAMREDLLAARAELASPDLLTIVSNHSLARDVALAPNLIPVDHRSRSVLGGTMIGLNARVAVNLLEWGASGPLTSARLRGRYVEMVRDAPKPKKAEREKQTDEQLLDYLRAQLAKDPRLGWTSLLRSFRADNKQCEQKRFKELHKRVGDELAGGVTTE